MNISLALKISDFSFHPNYLSDLLGLIASSTHNKGEEFCVGPPDNKVSKIYEENYWEYRVHITNNSVWVKTVIDQFIAEVIGAKQDVLKKIKSDCVMELYIGIQFKKNSNLDSFHFEPPTLKLLAGLNVAIDIDQYLFTD